MNDLISRQAAINAADRADYAGLAVEDVKKVTDEVVKELKQIPIADAVEVVHGEWIMINEQLAKCSVCGGYESTNGKDKTGKGVIFKTQKNFCPNCGADMRGEWRGDAK